MKIRLPEPQDIALYVHWPWCKSKCPYCDFNSHVNPNAPEEAYVQALLTDMEHQAQLLGNRRRLISIFFGGGTPSLMQPKYVETLIKKARHLFDFKDDIEITLEANPTSSEADKFKAFKAAGINRISIGMQSLRDENLKFLGREHSAREALNVIEAGMSIFNNLNFDLIYTLPEQNEQGWSSDLTKVLNLHPPHVSCYQLTFEKNTRFYSDLKNGKILPCNDATSANLFDLTRGTLVSHGYHNYETSNFCLNSMYCKHNTHIWNYGDYLGVGAGAHGRLTNTNKISTRNYRMPATYIQHITDRSNAFYEQIHLSKEDQLVERVLSGLRLQQGVSINALKTNNFNNLLKSESIQLLQNTDFIEIKDDCLRLTPKGWPLLDSVLKAIC